MEISGLVSSSVQRVFFPLGPGEIFGELAVIEHRPRSATATARQDTEVCFNSARRNAFALQSFAWLAFSLLQLISHRLREFNQFRLREMVQTESLSLLGRFAQSIVHDLKNPLNIISLYAAMFDMPSISSEIRAKTQFRIRRQVERISDMVSDILIFTEGQHMDAGRQPLAESN